MATPYLRNLYRRAGEFKASMQYLYGKAREEIVYQAEQWYYPPEINVTEGERKYLENPYAGQYENEEKIRHSHSVSLDWKNRELRKGRKIGKQKRREIAWYEKTVNRLNYPTQCTKAD